MNIRAYIKKYGLTQAEFGKKIGASQALVSGWYSKSRRVSPRKAKQIEMRTNGEITREELRPELFA